MHSTMMHYRPWPQYPQMLIEEDPYYQSLTHDMHLQFAMNEHQEGEYEQLRDEMPSETSDDQHHNADMFRLAFAASQWSKLVLNAEGLFNKLMSTNALPSNEQNLLKNQIEQWLCMKQEYEECIANDESVSLHGYTENTRRSLEIIEEVTETTETDEKTDESDNWACKQLQLKNKSCSSTSLNTSSKSENYDSTTDVTDDSDQSDVDSENSDFIDKIEESMKQFEIDTDDVINSMVNDFLKSSDNLSDSYCLKSNNSIPDSDVNSQNNSPEPNSVAHSGFMTDPKSGSMRKQSGRRTSILPCTEMGNALAEFQKQNCHSSNINTQQNDNEELIPLANFDSQKKTEIQVESNQYCAETSIDNNVKSENTKVDSSIVFDCAHLSTLKALRIDIIERQSEVNKVVYNLDWYRIQIKELQSTIQEKENLIEHLKKNLTARKIAKEKFRELQSRYEEKCVEYEKLLNGKSLKQNAGDKSYAREVENYRKSLMRYEKKLNHLKRIKQIISTSMATLEECEDSLYKSKKKMNSLQSQLKNEEKHKEELDKEINDCQKEVKRLEKAYNLTSANLKKMLSASEEGKNHRIKVKSDINECSIESNVKNVSINDSMKEKSNCKNVDDMDDEKESLRKEIRDLRHIRDLLIKLQCDKSDTKMHPMTKIDREVLRLSEFIECIDAMIEEKNVMICSKADLNQTRSNKIDEHISIFNRLEKLSHKELVTLFYKYFYKVIDLKETSQTLEIQNTELEGKNESQKLAHERELTALQKKYEIQLTMLLSYYPDESSSSVCDSKIARNGDMDKCYRDLFKENRELKLRLAHFEKSHFKSYKPETTQAILPHSIRGRTMFQYPQSVHTSSPHKPFVLIRGKNKMVLQKRDQK